MKKLYSSGWPGWLQVAFVLVAILVISFPINVPFDLPPAVLPYGFLFLLLVTIEVIIRFKNRT